MDPDHLLLPTPTPTPGASRRAAIATGILAFWTGVAVLYVLYEAYVYRELQRPVPWARVITVHLIEWWSWAPLTPLVFAFVRRVPLGSRPWGRTLRRYGIAAAAALLLNAAMIGAAWTLLPWYDKGLVGSFVEQVDRLFAFDIMLFALVALASHALLYYREVQQRDVRAAQLQLRLASAQLDVLTMQLQPHFLFNTLNTISGLVRLDPGRAEVVIARLADLLRFSLRPERPQLIPLAEEFAFAGGYLEIQRARFEERLSVSLTMDPGAGRALVPPFLLQPLVENAVRHAVAVSTDPVRVEVQAGVADGRLALVVRDDGPGLADAPPGPGNGIGLGNTRSRLSQLYGDRHSFVLREASGGGTEVRIELPYTEGA